MEYLSVSVQSAHGHAGLEVRVICVGEIIGDALVIT